MEIPALKAYCSLTVCLSILFFPLMFYGQSLYLRQFHPESFYEDVEFSTIYQKKSGLIWLGSDQGAFQFDGLAFKFYPFPDSSSFNLISAIGEDYSGKVWFGFENGKLAFLENDVIQSFEPEEGLPKKRISGFGYDAKKQFWFSTYGEGLYLLTSNRIYNFDEIDGLSSNDIYAMDISQDGQVWLATDRGISICSFDEGEKIIQKIGVNNGLPDLLVKDLLFDKKGNVWIGTHDKGICVIPAGSDQVEIPPQMQKWTYGPVNSLTILENKTVLVGTDRFGLISIDIQNEAGLKPLQSSGVALTKKIKKTIRDEEGNIWILDNDQGVKNYNPSFEFLEKRDFKFIENIKALLTGNNGHIWFGSDHGLFELNPFGDINQSFIPHLDEIFNSSSDLQIISLFEDRNGLIWIGTFGHGLFLYDPITKSYQFYNETSGLVNDNILSISGKEDDIWLGTLGGISLASFTGSDWEFTNFEPDGMLGGNYIYDVLVDSKDRIWIATDGKGLKVMDRSSIQTFTGDHQLDFKTVYSIQEDMNGNIWFTSPEKGLFKFDGQNFTQFTPERGLRNMDISAIEVDGFNRLLITHRTGIDVLDVSTNHINYFGSESGINNPNGNMNAICRSSDGSIWIGGQESLIKFNIHEEKPHMDPQIRLNEAQVFLEPIKAGKTKFSYKENHFTFDYIGIWYTNPEIVRYRHKLEGFDIDWIVSRDQLASYPHLKPGNYRFSVQATADQSFNFTNTASYEFVIAPPFWFRWWFISSSLILSVSLFFIWLKKRESRLNKEQKARNEKVEFQLQTLKSQVNPHFLFNSFNTLISIIEENQELAVEYVENLSDFFRNILRYRDIELIKIAEELEILKNYIQLLKHRFEANLDLQINVPSKIRLNKIPPLTFQLLIENAVKHNIISKDQPLIIIITYQENDSCILIRNNLQKKAGYKASTHFGLKNIDTRFQLLCGQGIEVEETPEFFTVTIPLIQ